jgi:transcription-repair coupling factor (superfamily II helicase)
LSLNSAAAAAHAFIAALVAQISGRPLLVVVADARAQENFLADLQTFAPSARAYPAWESLPHEDVLPQEQTIAERLAVLSALQRAPSGVVIVATAAALMQRTFSPDAFRRERLALAVGATMELATLVEKLSALGYHAQAQVGEPGDMAVRGGLVDFYPLDHESPVRVEFFGDKIESIRTFDPSSQQSRGKCDAIEFAAAGEVGFLKRAAAESASLRAFLPSDTALVLIEPDEVALAADVYARRVPENDPFFVPWPEWLQAGYATVHVSEQIALDEDDARVNLRVASLDAFRALDVVAPTAEVAEQSRAVFFDQLRRWDADGWSLQLFCDTDGERQRCDELCREHGLKLSARLGGLSRGFLWESARVAVITDAEIFGRYKQRRSRRQSYATAPVVDWTEFAEGDFVVHLQHGVGKYIGLREIETAGHKQEALALGYADDARLYVPLEQAHLVSKYVGLGKRVPDLHELGGALWERQKFRAERAIMDLAAELLEVQASRETLPGHAFAADAPWQREFEAMFPFSETPDQLTAIEEMKDDMERTRPMDRLICGDVGFGKTEVAIRAAFKAVMDGMQVAVLCPTTVLAEQHWNVFRERMAGFPVTVEMISRFRTPAEQKKIIALAREGGVDILIGTHRLLSADVSFKNLGLVVIDEEQRFGVLHKETFKQYRKLVDVLTMSATPIPRTLYMALTGARDMSVIQTPPANRLPVETHIVPFDERLIRQVIQRELARGGQVFFLHNRVQSIEAVATRLKNLFGGDSKVRIEIGHGQMAERDLERVMHRFVAGKIDVLVCTTIIESGLDIPNANTIIIDRADRFGLADLYQLRGRVGRCNRQAYAYILLPRHLQLIATARKRISAIKQYNSLGSGYKIAMRDLEIRGAGNLLGSEQSGHITTIGFELYCQLLQESVARMKGGKIKRPPQVTLRLDFLTGENGENLARIPESYIADAKLRIEIYRRIAQAAETGEIVALRDELRDRFGKLPRAVALLLGSAEARILAAAAKVDTLETKDDKVMPGWRGEFYQVDGKFPRLTNPRLEGKLTELKKLLESMAETRTHEHNQSRKESKRAAH